MNCVTCGEEIGNTTFHMCRNVITGQVSNAEHYMGIIAEALRDIADAMIERNKLDQARFEKEYPVRSQPRDAIVTHVPTREDKVKADQQGEDAEQSLDSWIQLKEAGYLEEEPDKEPDK